MDVEKKLDFLLDNTAKIMEHLTEQNKKLDNLNKDMTKIKATLDNDVTRKIDLLAEGFYGYTEKLPEINQAIDNIEDIKLNVDIIKAVVTKQSRDISKLKIIK